MSAKTCLSNPCLLHLCSKYKNWPCDKGGYSILKRKKMWEKRKHPCLDCKKYIGPNIFYCYSCRYKYFPHHLKGKKLSDLWKENISKGQLKRTDLWKGDNAGYSAIHKWVRKWFSKKDYCEGCNKKNCLLDFANKSGEYKRIPEDWITLCKKCHKKQELEVKEKRFYWNGKAEVFLNDRGIEVQ